MAGNPSKPYSNRVGLKDVAEACSLSVMTVSRALNNAYGVRPSTREKVLKTARKLGYIQNTLAASLVQNRTATVGVIIPEIDHTFFPVLVKGLESVLSAEDYRLFLCCSYDKPEKELQEAQSLLARRVDGIILAPASMEQSRETIQLIRQYGVPVILVDRRMPEEDEDAVCFDDYEGAYQAVMHLAQQGYQQIAHLAGPPQVWTSEQRLRGYRDALSKLNLPHPNQNVIRGGMLVEDGERGMDRLLSRSPRPDAVFCVNDPVALGALKTLKRHDISVPDAMGIVGFANILDTELLAVPLTTLSQDAMTVGQEAADLLLSRMRNASETDTPVQRTIKTELIVRESSRSRVRR